MENAYKVTTFKERFSDLLDGSDKTLMELSKELHVSNQTLSAWKLGTRSPKEPTIIAIANHFHVSVEWLMGFNVPKQGNQQETEASEIPKTTEARIVSGGMDRLPQEQREMILNMVRAMFPNKFEEDKNNDA